MLPRPIFTISPDGAAATSIDFIRLGRGRPGAQIPRGPGLALLASLLQRGAGDWKILQTGIAWIAVVKAAQHVAAGYRCSCSWEAHCSPPIAS